MVGVLTSAYLDGGYQLTRPRTQWSAIRSNGAAVALSVWDDEIDRSSEPWHLDCLTHPNWAAVVGHLGNRDRIRDIRHGLHHCGGRFDLILLHARFSQDTASAATWRQNRNVLARLAGRNPD